MHDLGGKWREEGGMGENDPENDRPQTCHMIEVINDGLPSWKRRGLQIETRISRARVGTNFVSLKEK